MRRQSLWVALQFVEVLKNPTHFDQLRNRLTFPVSKFRSVRRKPNCLGLVDDRPALLDGPVTVRNQQRHNQSCNRFSHKRILPYAVTCRPFLAYAALVSSSFSSKNVEALSLQKHRQ